MSTNKEFMNFCVTFMHINCSNLVTGERQYMVCGIFKHECVWFAARCYQKQMTLRQKM